MGNNFYTKWVDKPTSGYTTFKVASMDPPLAGLDRGITYLKNPIIHCDGTIAYVSSTGTLSWSNTLRILFNRADGKAIQNTVAAGNVVLADNQFAYVDLNETDGSVLTVSAADITTNTASNFLAFNRLMLGYRNTASDMYFPAYLQLNSPIFTGLLISGLTASLPVVTDELKNLASLAYTGATSLRKNLALETTDSPSFAGLAVTGTSSVGSLIFTGSGLNDATLWGHIWDLGRKH